MESARSEVCLEGVTLAIRLRSPRGGIVTTSERKAKQLQKMGWTLAEEKAPTAPKRRGRPRKVK